MSAVKKCFGRPWRQASPQAGLASPKEKTPNWARPVPFAALDFSRDLVFDMGAASPKGIFIKLGPASQPAQDLT